MYGFCLGTRKSGRCLGDRGECARCRNGDLQTIRRNPQTTIQVAVESVKGTKEPSSTSPFGPPGAFMTIQGSGAQIAGRAIPLPRFQFKGLRRLTRVSAIVILL